MKRDNVSNKAARVIAMVSILTLFVLGAFIYFENRKYVQVSENEYNEALYELINYVQNVESYLAKALISTTSEHGAETLTNVWREANLAQVYLSQLPAQNNELQNTQKFLNQVSDYSYTLSRKNIYNEQLSEEDLKNLDELYKYSVELEETLNGLATDMDNGTISWKDITKKSNNVFAQEVSNISKDSFSRLEENFHEYSGLIYDGAFSEHLTTSEKKGLTGDEIDEEKANQIAKAFVGNDRVSEISSNGESENTDIKTFDFNIKLNEENNSSNITISVSKIGGHIVYMNSDRNVTDEKISEDEANNKAKEFLNSRDIKDMKETYYLKQEGIVTINYAYQQNDVVIYPDLIKVKVALDNGEILGIETTGYLNSHYERVLAEPKITKEEAKKNINKSLEIQSEGLAVIPTEYETEILCWEFKGKVEDRDYLVYINAENGREEDILLIVDTPNGILTM